MGKILTSEDYRTAIVDGKEELVLSGRGVILFAYSAWMDDRMTRARDVLVRYCQYLAMHRYNGGATKALAELDALDKNDGAEWIRKTYARYISSDTSVIGYVMPNG